MNAQSFTLLYRVWILKSFEGNNGAVTEVELPRLRPREEIETLLVKGYVIRTKLADVRVSS